MTTSIKKLLLISITLLLGVMNSGVMAQTDYTYTETFINTGGGSNETFSGVFQTNTGVGDQAILGWSNLTFGTNTNPSLNPAATYFASSHSYQPLGGYNAQTNMFTNDGYSSWVMFTSNINNGYGNTSWAISLFNGNDNHNSAIYACSSSNCSESLWGTSLSSSTNYTVTTGGAPEIDGSLAPKVGFLLGCLFLMFGRKKQDAEPMLTA